VPTVRRQSTEFAEVTSFALLDRVKFFPGRRPTARDNEGYTAGSARSVPGTVSPVVWQEQPSAASRRRAPTEAGVPVSGWSAEHSRVERDGRVKAEELSRGEESWLAHAAVTHPVIP
jgi:hypothetical protein